MSETKTICVNRKAYHDYHIEDTFEAGLVLTGTEIKSIQQGKVSLRDAYARPEDGELWLVGAHIARYQQGGRYNHEPTRPRKLLLHKDEIRRLSAAVERKGLTLVPLRLYLKRGIAKVELALVRGKKLYDKRQVIMEREVEREVARRMRKSR